MVLVCWNYLTNICLIWLSSWQRFTEYEVFPVPLTGEHFCIQDANGWQVRSSDTSPHAWQASNLRTGFSVFHNRPASCSTQPWGSSRPPCSWLSSTQCLRLSRWVVAVMATSLQGPIGTSLGWISGLLSSLWWSCSSSQEQVATGWGTQRFLFGLLQWTCVDMYDWIITITLKIMDASDLTSVSFYNHESWFIHILIHGIYLLGIECP